MASVIAHDLNQPLTAAAHYVRGARQLLRKDAGLSAEVSTALDEADRAIVRSAEIVRRMRDFVARGHAEKQIEPLNDVLREVCAFALSDAARRGIAYRTLLSGQPAVLIDRVQIQQVLVNLLRNAVEAVCARPTREILITTAPTVTGMYKVQVSDTGPGISETATARLFDPFYTTREDGMGLGLAISRMIVEAHGGSIWTEPREGGGTVVTFTLPTAQEVSGLPDPEAAL